MATAERAIAKAAAKRRSMFRVIVYSFQCVRLRDDPASCPTSAGGVPVLRNGRIQGFLGFARPRPTCTNPKGWGIFPIGGIGVTASSPSAPRWKLIKAGGPLTDWLVKAIYFRNRGGKRTFERAASRSFQLLLKVRPEADRFLQSARQGTRFRQGQFQAYSSPEFRIPA